MDTQRACARSEDDIIDRHPGGVLDPADVVEIELCQ
jgi:hypothetical protein